MNSLLIYKIKDLKSHEDGREIRIFPSEEFLSRELSQLEIEIQRSSAEVEGRLLYLPGDQVEFKGLLKVNFGLFCQRCLEPAQVFLENPFYILFVPEKNGIEVQERVDEEFDPNAADVVFHNHEQIDLRPVLREQILLMVPMTILCKESCLGLCPTCGENRNVVACECKPDLSFSPFSVLQHFSETR